MKRRKRKMKRVYQLPPQHQVLHHQSEQKKNPVVLPYVKEVFGQVRRVFKSNDIPAYFKPFSIFVNFWYAPRTSWRSGKW